LGSDAAVFKTVRSLPDSAGALIWQGQLLSELTTKQLAAQKEEKKEEEDSAMSPAKRKEGECGRLLRALRNGEITLADLKRINSQVAKGDGSLPPDLPHLQRFPQSILSLSRVTADEGESKKPPTKALKKGGGSSSGTDAAARKKVPVKATKKEGGKPAGVEASKGSNDGKGATGDAPCPGPPAQCATKHALKAMQNSEEEAHQEPKAMAGRGIGCVHPINGTRFAAAVATASGTPPPPSTDGKRSINQVMSGVQHGENTKQSPRGSGLIRRRRTGSRCRFPDDW
jgi:hypothetical protein